MTKTEIKKAAAEYGYPVEEPKSEYGEIYIGVKMTEYCWSWWFFYSDNGHGSYSHTYSQNTGKRDKNKKRGSAKQRKLEKILEKIGYYS